MTNTSDKINFYMDSLIVESLVRNPLTKEAGIVSDIIEKVKNYFSSETKKDPNNKVDSIMRLLEPTAILVMFSAIGMPVIGFVVDYAISTSGIDIHGFLKSVYNGIKSLISGDKKTSSQETDSVVENIAQSFKPPEVEEKPKKGSLRDVRIIKLAIIQNSMNRNYKFIKSASIASSLFKVIVIIIKWVFKIGLASAGALVLGDATNKFLGLETPSTLERAKTELAPVLQTKFKPKPNADRRFISSELIQNYTNTREGISDMLVDFAKSVYNGLDGLESIIKSTPGFKAVLDTVIWHNHETPGDLVVFVPGIFKSKKEIVDSFIVEVVEKAP